MKAKEMETVCKLDHGILGKSIWFATLISLRGWMLHLMWFYALKY